MKPFGVERYSDGSIKLRLLEYSKIADADAIYLSSSAITTWEWNTIIDKLIEQLEKSRQEGHSAMERMQK